MGWICQGALGWVILLSGRSRRTFCLSLVHAPRADVVFDAVLLMLTSGEELFLSVYE